MPARTAASTACTSGSVFALSKGGWPSDRLMMSMPRLTRFAVANSIALMTSLVEPWPCPSRTFITTNLTSGAMPASAPPLSAPDSADQAGHVRAVAVRVGRRGAATPPWVKS